ncbi:MULTISPECIES: hypothetical protein [unclassified Leptospira]|uniref:hypothetical protein n=1 Tax=unclassified Leptospira TaxID=2633828 RepID=UPI0002BE6E69|nr:MULTISPECIES: hypothetical protein [unclassified Leptospira]EMK02331.1 hypothetical protein LEP1GSC192_2078 [Leptospira sp. B5-022]MCR1793587.1 hypothetical protein [Leptospira sp. id769339]
MQFFPQFFPILEVFPLASASLSTWIDGEVLALGGISFCLLSLFGYVVHTTMDRREEKDTESEVPFFQSILKEEVPEGQKQAAFEKIPSEEGVPSIFSQDESLYLLKEEVPKETKTPFQSFYIPVRGKTYEAVRSFLDSIRVGEEDWEVLLHDSKGDLQTVASKTGSISVFPSERKRATEPKEGAIVWKLEWDSFSLGEVRQTSSSLSEFSLDEISFRLDKLVEGLVLAGESQDGETGWSSYPVFSQHLEREKVEGEETKILVFLEFESDGDLVSDFRSLGNWWKSRFGENFSIYRIRKNRLATFFYAEDWMKFQNSLSGLMEFLGPEKTRLNVGASVRVRKDDSEWEPRAKKALHSSKEEGPNRLVCL